MTALIDKYYRIDYRTAYEDDTLFGITLLPDYYVYKGHFPDNPISPGVLNIQLIKECVEHLAGRRLFLSYIDKCRFSAVITPLKTALPTQSSSAPQMPSPSPSQLQLRIHYLGRGGINETLDDHDSKVRQTVAYVNNTIKVHASLNDDTTTYIEFKGEFTTIR